MDEKMAYVNGYLRGYMAAVRDANPGGESVITPEIIDAFWAAIVRLHGENLADFVPDFAPIFACQPVISNQDF